MAEMDRGAMRSAPLARRTLLWRASLALPLAYSITALPRRRASAGRFDTPEPESPGEIRYARSLPLGKAKRRQVLLAYGMNGSDLPPEHGHPVRAVGAGRYGVASVKWLRRIDLDGHARRSVDAVCLALLRALVERPRAAWLARLAGSSDQRPRRHAAMQRDADRRDAVINHVQPIEVLVE